MSAASVRVGLFTAATAILALVPAGGCRPDLALDESLIVTARVIAVRADPPEAKPGARVTYTAEVVTPLGAAPLADPRWSFCDAPKPLTEDNVVSSACLDSASLAPPSRGTVVDLALPSRACALFGPEAPPGGFRPRDPDVTGGYYQPLRVDVGDAPPSFVLSRVSCALANASFDETVAFAAAYVPNANPRLLPLDVRQAGISLDVAAIPAGARVDLLASWAPADAETYAYFDPATHAVTTKREAMRVAWYATGGSFKDASTGRDETDPVTSTTNSWTAPTAAGQVSLWIVLRDSRGGLDFATYAFVVVP